MNSKTANKVASKPKQKRSARRPRQAEHVPPVSRSAAVSQAPVSQPAAQPPAAIADLVTQPPATAFPATATPKTPGQAQSRLGLAALQSKIDGTPWECDFYHLLEQGFEWRVAVFIAWASSPVVGRVPKTQGQLATEYMNLESDRMIRRWRKMNPKIDQFIAKMKAEPLLRYRDAAFRTLGELAIREDPDTHQDRQLFFEMTGDYRPKSSMTLVGPHNGPVEVIDLGVLAGMNEAELERFTANLEAAIRGSVVGTPAPASSGAPSGDQQSTQQRAE